MFTEAGVKVDAAKLIRRDTDGAQLGVVGNRYVPLQNAKAFEWFEPFIEAGEAEFHTAGSLRGGQRVFVLAKVVNGEFDIVKSDAVESYVLLSHGHDGKLAIRVGFTPIRVVCNNTLSLAHSDKASKLIRSRHTARTAANLDVIRDTMNLARQEFAATAEQYRFLASKDISRADVVRYVKVLFGFDSETEELPKQSRDLIAEIEGLVDGGMGQSMAGVHGTYWAAYNGVTEYLSYGYGRSADNRMNSLWWGPNAALNVKALALATEMASAA
jgi:phage/plasmid-like protein (TIGR03299 family)